MAPAESSGAAVAAPPIDRLIGPTPLMASPNCARAGVVPMATEPTNTARPNQSDVVGRKGMGGPHFERVVGVATVLPVLSVILSGFLKRNPGNVLPRRRDIGD